MTDALLSHESRKNELMRETVLKYYIIEWVHRV